MAGHVWEDYAEERVREELQRHLAPVSAQVSALVSTGPILANTTALDAQILQLEATIQQKEAEIANNDTWLERWFGQVDLAGRERQLIAYQAEHAELVAQRQMVTDLNQDIQKLEKQTASLRAQIATFGGNTVVVPCTSCLNIALSTSAFSEQWYKAEIARLQKEADRLKADLQAALGANGAAYTPEQVEAIKEALKLHAIKMREKLEEDYKHELSVKEAKLQNTQWRGKLAYMFTASQLFYLIPMKTEKEYYQELIKDAVLTSETEFREAMADNGFSGNLDTAMALFKEQYKARTTRVAVIPTQTTEADPTKPPPQAIPTIDQEWIHTATIELAKYIAGEDEDVFGPTYTNYVLRMDDSVLPVGITLKSIQDNLELALADEFTIPDLENIIIGTALSRADQPLPLQKILSRLSYKQKTNTAVIRTMMTRLGEFSSSLNISLHSKVGAESDLALINQFKIWNDLANEAMPVQQIVQSVTTRTEKYAWVQRMQNYASVKLKGLLEKVQKGLIKWTDNYRLYRTFFAISSELPVMQTVWPTDDPSTDRSAWPNDDIVVQKAIVTLQQETGLRNTIVARLKLESRFDKLFTEQERRDACATAGLDYDKELQAINNAATSVQNNPPSRPAAGFLGNILGAGVGQLKKTGLNP